MFFKMLTVGFLLGKTSKWALTICQEATVHRLQWCSTRNSNTCPTDNLHESGSLGTHEIPGPYSKSAKLKISKFVSFNQREHALFA